MGEATSVQKKNYEKFTKGQKLYEQLKEITETQFIICPIGIGDTMNIGALVQSYKEANNFDHVVLVLRRAHELAANFPGVDGVKFVEQEDMENLQGYAFMSGAYDDENVHYGHFRLNRKLIKAEGSGPAYLVKDESLSYLDGFKVNVLGLSKEAAVSSMTLVKKEAPQYKDSVLLIPYANTFKALPESFWIKVAQRAKEKGHDVYTNVKDGTEKVIPGTKPFAQSVTETALISHEFSNIIALRSGMCDVLSFTDCRLSVLYPHNQTTQPDGCTMDDKDIICDVRDLHNREGIHNYICYEGNEEKLIEMLVE